MTRGGFVRIVVAVGLFLSMPSVPAFAQACDPPAARIVSAQGAVEARRANQSQWVKAGLDDRLCPGDGLRTGPSSRAALALPDQTVTRVDQNTVISFPPPQDEKKTWLEVLEGALHIITRDRRALRVLTPFANAGIDGTEFLVTVSKTQAAILVFEGQVTLQGANAAASAGANQQVVAAAGAAPVVSAVVRPRDAVQWTLYYPPVTAATAAVAPEASAAARALAVGRVDEAQAALDRALIRDPANGEALALRSVIALAQNEREAARGFADQAVAAAPASAAALVARSYVQQADLDLAGVLQSLQQATGAEPGNAIAQARLAEIQLAFGDAEAAIATAKRAVAADPALALPHAVLGFAYLAGVETGAARAAFDEAIRLDSAAPLPRLGRGLALIRAGDLAAGREEIELAVILDPGNALIRSYMGKAYYEEKRDALAATQLGIAKGLDPLDPTAFFYDAIRKQTVNRPVEALEDLQQSVALNDNRAVYRSSLLLDDDAAARNASVSAVYEELGFDELAELQGAQAVVDNYASSPAHRLLGNTYARLPRYDIARVSETFQAQVRQPLSAPPINLLDSADRLTIVRDAGPARVGVNEYNSLFNRDQLRIQTDAIVGSDDTWGDQFVASGLEGSVGFGLSQLHYETDGFDDNDDAERNLYDGFLQIDTSPDSSWQINARHGDLKLGNTFFGFDPTFAIPDRLEEDGDSLRINGRHSGGPASEVVWSVGFEDRTRDVFYVPLDILVTRTDADSYTADVQRVDRLKSWQVITGASFIKVREDFPVEQAEIDSSAGNTYAYAQWQSGDEALVLVGGLSYDYLRQRYTTFTENIERNQLNPKFGFIWTARPGTVVRGAALAAVHRPLIGSSMLEPTSVVGFNQYFSGYDQYFGDREGGVTHRVGLSVDQAITTRLFGGLEGTLRSFDVPSLVLGGDRTWREKSARGYVYRTFGPGSVLPAGWNATASLTAEYEDVERPGDLTGTEAILDLDTFRLPLGVAIFAPGGLSLRLTGTYLRQHGDFQIDTFFPVNQSDDDEWVTDVQVEYRLPQRRGVVSLGVRNLFDSSLTIVETDPFSPRIARGRLGLLTISLVF